MQDSASVPTISRVRCRKGQPDRYPQVDLAAVHALFFDLQQPAIDVRCGLETWCKRHDRVLRAWKRASTNGAYRCYWAARGASASLSRMHSPTTEFA
jgi:hypothetical protein